MIEGRLFSTPVMFKVVDNKLKLFGSHEIDMPSNLGDIEFISVNYGEHTIYAMFVDEHKTVEMIDVFEFSNKLDDEYKYLFWNQER